MTRTARVATVILNYRAPDDTVRAVDSLRRSTVLDQRVIVVDNSEADDAHRELATRLGTGVECVASGGNLGYAGGNNVGIRMALAGDPAFVWLLNPDTEVEPTTLERLLAAAEEVGDAGTIGARILYPDGRRIWFDGGVVDEARFGATSHLHTGCEAESIPALRPHDVDYVTGACLLIRRGVFRRVGLLPEDYFLYFEETAFCRAVRLAGWRNIVEPRARMTHYKRSSGDLVTPYYLYYMTRNRLRFAREFFGAEPEAVLPDFESSFLGPWRDRVSRRAPEWLSTYEAIVAKAVADARSGVVGRVREIEDLPDPTRPGVAAGCEQAC